MTSMINNKNKFIIIMVIIINNQTPTPSSSSYSTHLASIMCDPKARIIQVWVKETERKRK